jgi:hypothetical protein
MQAVLIALFILLNDEKYPPSTNTINGVAQPYNGTSIGKNAYTVEIKTLLAVRSTTRGSTTIYQHH